MSWSFDDSLSDPKDQVRLLVGDVFVGDQLASDEAINFHLEQAGDGLYTAAASVCRSIAGRFAREVSASLSGLSESASDRFEHFKDLAEEYKREANRRGEPTTGTAGADADGGPFVSGTSVKEMIAVERDRDRPRHPFNRYDGFGEDDEVHRRHRRSGGFGAGY